MTVLQNWTSEEVYTLDGEGILLTEWMADTLGVSAGDSITMEKRGRQQQSGSTGHGRGRKLHYELCIHVAGILEKIYGEPAEFEVMYAEFTPEGQEREKELGQKSFSSRVCIM